MAPDLGLTSLVPFPKSNQTPSQFAFIGWMWNNNGSSNNNINQIESMWNNNSSNNNNDNINQMSRNDDDSWEVRAFEEDTTGNVLGCTWPPRSYTCTFCRREFRSAQALGGHMNVHRRDRARLHEAPALLPPSPPPPILIQTRREFVDNGGLCLVYPLPNPNSVIFPNPPHIDYSTNIPHFVANIPTETAPNSFVSSVCHSSNTNDDDDNNNRGLVEITKDSGGEEELDLELRLG